MTPGKKARGKIPGGFFLSGVDEGGFPGYVIEDQWFHTTREEWVFHASFSAAAGFTVCNFRNFVRGFGITSGWENRHRSQGFRYCAGRDIHSGSSARRPEKILSYEPAGLVRRGSRLVCPCRGVVSGQGRGSAGLRDRFRRDVRPHFSAQFCHSPVFPAETGRGAACKFSAAAL